MPRVVEPIFALAQAIVVSSTRPRWTAYGEWMLRAGESLV